MSKALLKTILSLAVLMAIGPLAAELLRGLRGAGGNPVTTPLTCTSPAVGAALMLVVMGVAALVGWVGARGFHNGLGMWLCGFVLTWAAWRTGSAGEVLRELGSGAKLIPLAAETAILGVAALAATVLFECSGRWVLTPGQEEHVGALERAKPAEVWKGLLSGPGLASVAVGMLVGGAVAWLLAVDSLKGQSVMAAIVGGLAAGAGAQLVTMSMEPARAPSVLPGMVAMVLLAVAAPIVARVMHGAENIEAVARAVGSGVSGRAELFPLARIMPLDWIAGAFIGTPVGLGWAASMVEKRQPAEA